MGDAGVGGGRAGVVNHTPLSRQAAQSAVQGEIKHSHLCWGV